MPIAALALSSLVASPARRIFAAAGSFGRVDFANSGAAAAQADFAAGLALLHDFEYPPLPRRSPRADRRPRFRHGLLGRGDDLQPSDLDAAGRRRGARRARPPRADRGGAPRQGADRAREGLARRRRDPLRGGRPRSAGDGRGRARKRARDFRYAAAMARLQRELSGRRRRRRLPRSRDPRHRPLRARRDRATCAPPASSRRPG